MFGLTKNSSQINSVTSDPNQPSALNIENAPIHTMQDDLKNIKDPNTKHSQTQETIKEESSLIEKPIISQKQSNSPFLNLSDKNPLNGIITSDEKHQQIEPLESFSRRTNQTQDTGGVLTRKNHTLGKNAFDFKSTPSIAKDHSVFHYNWRMIFFSTLSIFLIIVLGWIGFNYKQDKNFNPFKEYPQLNPQQTVTPSIEPGNIPTPTETVEKPKLTFSETNPNYLRLESPDLDSEKTKAILKQYLDTTSKESYSAPVEFIITDAQNKALSFKAFSNLLGLKFSPALMALLGENFSLYIYNDIAAPKLSIAIESRDDINLAKVMLSEEKNLADEISPLFFTSEYRAEKAFAGSEYGGAKVRYQNIISPDMLSVDYTVYKNKLIIGTTKLTLRSIIDKIK